MPYSNDPENIWYYHASFSAKSIWPLYFKNVFYHAPNCKIFNEALEELGFKTFFVNDSQFLQAMNEDYYYNHEVQEKLFLMKKEFLMQIILMEILKYFKNEKTA